MPISIISIYNIYMPRYGSRFEIVLKYYSILYFRSVYIDTVAPFCPKIF